MTIIDTTVSAKKPLDLRKDSHNYASIRITNKLGLHARPSMYAADYFAMCPGEILASKSSDLNHDFRKLDYIDATSIMNLMMLCVVKGEVLHVKYDTQSNEIENAIKVIKGVIEFDDSGLSLEDILAKIG